MAATKEARAQATLERNQRAANNLADKAGQARTRELLEDAAADLEERLESIIARGGADTFTAAQLEGALAQVRAVLAGFSVEFRQELTDQAVGAAEEAAQNAIDYMMYADEAFRGLGEDALALNEAGMLDAAAEGARASVLRRLASSGEDVEGADEEEHPAKLGVLERYGTETINEFEGILRRGMVAKKSWIDMRQELIDESPFLQGKPMYWAHRIVRTEVMGAYGRAMLKSVHHAHKDLGDMVKILTAVFDERTAADSYATHGQIRRPDEMFETWYGAIDAPPDRPNDRGTITPHRIAWKIPPYLEWKTDEQIADRWELEGRKGAPPERPLMTTVDLDEFGRSESESASTESAKSKSESDEGGEEPGEE